MICDLCGMERALAHVCLDALKAERKRLLLENGVLRKALEDIVSMEAATDEERARPYWTDRAERMRDHAMIALGPSEVPLVCAVCKGPRPEEAWSGICADCQDRGL